MRATVQFDKFACVCKVIARSSHHFCKFSKQIMLSGDFDHFVKFRYLHESLAETIHSVCKFRTFIVDFLIHIDYLLVQNLITLSKCLHFAAKYSAVLLYLNVDLSIKSEKLSQIFRNFYFFVLFEGLLPVFWINNCKEVNNKTTCFQFFTSTDCLKKSLELLLAPIQYFIHELCVFERKWRNHQKGKLKFK
jgi:hypothetical protein